MKKLALVVLGLAAAACGSGKGQFHATWAIQVNGASSDCTAVGATKVSVLSTAVGTQNGNDDVFNCTDFMGTTDSYDSGDYTVSFSLLGSDGVTSIDTLSPPVDATLFSDSTTELPQAVFTFTQ